MISSFIIFWLVDCEAHWKMISQVLPLSMFSLRSVWAYVLMVFMKLASPIWWDFNFYKTAQQCASDTVAAAAAAVAKSLKLCPILCNPIDSSPRGSPIHRILQARTLEWVAISFSNAWKWKVKVKSLSRVQPSATPWTAAFQAPPSMGFSRREYWSGVPLPSPT